MGIHMLSFSLRAGFAFAYCLGKYFFYTLSVSFFLIILAPVIYFILLPLEIHRLQYFVVQNASLFRSRILFNAGR